MIGFSTGAIAFSNFYHGLQILSDQNVTVVEISALRMTEWQPLIQALDHLDLSAFDFVSIHLPSAMNATEEISVTQSLRGIQQRKYPFILHPDVITDFGQWREFGKLICVENMDKRKAIGRTEVELEVIFRQLPEARFCFDIGHAWQVDPTMTEAYSILKCYREKLTQIHVSEVNSRSKHDKLSYATIQSFRDVAHMIPAGLPIILETPVSPNEMRDEMNKARFALTPLGSPSELVA